MAVTESQRDAQAHEDRGVPLWTTALTLVLLWLGFRPARYAGSASRPSERDTRQSRVAAASEANRGRLARAPSDIPARGWKDILLRVYKNLSKDRVVLIAAGITFYSILALFPAVAAIVALYGLFADPSSIATHLGNLAGVMPEGAIQVIQEQMTRVAAQGNNTLGLTFIAALAIALWSANAGVKSLFDGLNLVYNEQEKRSLIRLNIVSLTFTTGAILFLLVSMGTIVVLPLLLNNLGLDQSTELLVSVSKWPLLLLVVTFALAVLYRYGPSREAPKWRWITWGSAFAAIVWLAASILFSWYAANFGNYNKTYGSLGAVIGFMIWIWLSVIVILIGAEIDAEAEHQTARDTTTGAPKPMGSRGATMADTVGAAQDAA